MTTDLLLYKNVEFEDIDYKDAPDFCDAFISYAEHIDGTPLTTDELDILNDSCTKHELLWDYIL